MVETQYEVIKERALEFPVRNLLRTPRSIVSLDAFGPNTYPTNLMEMKEQYSHPQTGERITFREPTTAESISATAYEFEQKAKPQIFDLRWLQLGRIVRTQEGVFVNPPKDKDGKPIIEESVLKQMLNGVKPVGGIYILANDFGFAPYETFERGVQEAEKFAEGGLARLLEHSEGKVAENLKKISAKKNYPRGVNVWGFDDVNGPVLRVAALFSDEDIDGRLNVGGGWFDDDDGYAFGVLNETEVAEESAGHRR